jgi:restriction system protein
MARRAQSTFLDDLYFIFSKLPWWLGIILAPISYFFINSFVVMPTLDPKQPVAHLFDSMVYQVASIARYVLPAVIILGSLKSALSMLKRLSLINGVRNSTHEDPSKALESISWSEFEMLVGQYFKELGYRVVETGGRADGGVDLRLRSENAELFLVQCKHWKSSKVPVNVVREIYGVMKAEYANGAFVVASGEFTADAATFAKGKAIELVDGRLLLNSIKNRLQIPANLTNPTQLESNSPNFILCPICKSQMVLRTAKRGANAGNSFFGCSRYPSCRGTRPA